MNEIEKKYDSENPLECWSSSNNRNETIYLLPDFVVADINGNKEKGIKGEDPGKIDGKYSKVRICILGRKIGSGYANIRYKDWPNIVKRTEHAEIVAMQYEPKIAAAKENCGGTSPAYTTKLSGNMLKGKTAAQVIFENGGEATLRSQRDWLAKNLSGKFAKSNREQIAAIDDALNLYSNGQLNRPASITLPVINIYTAQFHANTYIQHESNPNLFFTFDCYINYCIGDEYPIKVRILNYYCPVTVKEDGQQIVHADKKEDEKEYTFALSESGWDHAITMVQERRTIFLSDNATQISKNITTVSIANAEAAKARKNDTNSRNTSVRSQGQTVSSNGAAPMSRGNCEQVTSGQNGIVTNFPITTCSSFVETDKFFKVPVLTEHSNGPMYLLFRKSGLQNLSWFGKFYDKANDGRATMVINGEVKDNCILFGSVGNIA